MIRVTTIVKTCEACPSQWEGLTDDDREVYVRYRWSQGRVTVGAPGDHAEFAGVRGETVAEFELPGDDSGFGGTVTTDEMMDLTSDKIDWSAVRGPIEREVGK